MGTATKGSLSPFLFRFFPNSFRKKEKSFRFFPFLSGSTYARETCVFPVYIELASRAAGVVTLHPELKITRYGKEI